jgi:hypothetical protein
MRRYLVVANRSLAGHHLVEYVRRCLTSGPCWFFVLVPATVVHGDAVMTEDEARALARSRLAGALARFRAEGASVNGGVGDTNPLRAVADAVERMRFDEIVLSTLPVGASRWLTEDLPARLERATGLHVTHLPADGSSALLPEAVAM